MPMETMLDAVGLAMLAASAASACLCLLAWHSRFPARIVLLGISVLVCFIVTRLMLERLLPVLTTAPAVLRAVLTQMLDSLALLSGALTLDAALRHWIWYGRLGDGARSKVPNILISLASLGLYAVAALLIASSVLGLDLTAVAATSGVVAIVLGVSAQQSLGQVFAGVALNTSRPFRLGDSVQVDGVWGVVADADWRAVTLRTYEGTLVTLPNTTVASARLTNLGRHGSALRHHIPFHIDIDVPPGEVRRVALAALMGCPHVLAEPEPLVLFKNFEDRGAAYEAIFWHHDPNAYILRRDEVGQALWYGLHNAGIAFAVNRRLVSAVDAPPRTEEPEPLASLPAVLRASGLFACFPDEDIDALAVGARPLLFGAGERVFAVGAAGQSLFVILRGQVSVRLPDGEHAEAEIYQLRDGEIFGHMSALTGAPRFATVRAIDDLELAEIGGAALCALIARHPEVVEAVARESLRIEAAREALAAARATAPAAPKGEQTGLLDRVTDRIRSYLGQRGSLVPR